MVLSILCGLISWAAGVIHKSFGFLEFQIGMYLMEENKNKRLFYTFNIVFVFVFLAQSN